MLRSNFDAESGLARSCRKACGAGGWLRFVKGKRFASILMPD
jgi:hypothetical protein